MSEQDLLHLEKISLIDFKISSIEKELDLTSLFQNINVKSFKNIEDIIYRNLSSEYFEVIHSSKGISKRRDNHTRKRPSYIIRINKNSINYIIPPLDYKIDYRNLIEELSADNEIINIAIIRSDKKEKKTKDRS